MARKTTAMKSALEAAGFQSPQERLDEIADTIDGRVRSGVLKPSDMRQAVLDAVHPHAELHWTFFAPWSSQAADALMLAAVQRRLEKSRANQPKPAKPGSGANTTANTNARPPQHGASSGRKAAAGFTQAQRDAATQAVNRTMSKLYTFVINGKPIGECTVREARGFRVARLRDARYIELMTAGLPGDNAIVGQYHNWEEADVLFAQAEEETSNV